MVRIQLDIFNNAMAIAVTTVTTIATVKIEVSLSDFQNTFLLKTNGDLTNPDTNLSLQYYIDTAENTSKYSICGNVPDRLNPAFGPVHLYPATFVDDTGVSLSTEELGVVNDYVRNLASQYFYDPQLTYLFTNVPAMKTSVVANMQSAVGGLKNLMLELDKTVGTSGLLSTDSDGKYTDNTATTTANICRSIFFSIFGQAPARFSGFGATVSPMPFEVGDVVSFVVSVDNANVLMPTVSYTIDLVLMEVPINVAYDSLAAEYNI